MVRSATSLSPFQWSLWATSPPFFPHRRQRLRYPRFGPFSIQCRCIWKAARHTMINTRDWVQRFANRRRVPAPAYRPGQKVWLLAKDVPLPTLSRKLAPRYVGPYIIERVVNSSAYGLTLALCVSLVILGQSCGPQKFHSPISRGYNRITEPNNCFLWTQDDPKYRSARRCRLLVSPVWRPWCGATPCNWPN